MNRSFINGWVLAAALSAMIPLPSPASDDAAGSATTTAAAALPAVLSREEIEAFVLPSNAARLEYLKKALAERGLEFVSQPVGARLRFLSQEPRKSGENLIVTLGPDDAKTEIVIGAHFDTVKLGDTVCEGLIDNAVAVAVMIRAAESLKTETFQRRIRFVFFDMEEIGLLGSRKYVRESKPETIAGMVNLDVVGLKGPIVYGSSRFALSKPLCDIMNAVAEDSGVAAIQTKDFPGSDFISFRVKQIPFLQFSTLPEKSARIAETWNEGASVGHVFRYIHSSRDSIAAVDLPTVNTAHATLVRLICALDQQLPMEPRDPLPKEPPKPAGPVKTPGTS